MVLESLPKSILHSEICTEDEVESFEEQTGKEKLLDLATAQTALGDLFFLSLKCYTSITKD